MEGEALMVRHVMGCDIIGCNNRGINHLYNDGSMIGKYCDECLKSLIGHYRHAKIKRYPRTGTTEYRATEITEKLQERGIEATRTKKNGIKVVIPEDMYDEKRDDIIEVLGTT